MACIMLRIYPKEFFFYSVCIIKNVLVYALPLKIINFAIS